MGGWKYPNIMGKSSNVGNYKLCSHAHYTSLSHILRIPDSHNVEMVRLERREYRERRRKLWTNLSNAYFLAEERRQKKWLETEK